MKTTQTEIANKIGVTQQMVSAIMLGKARPSWDTAKRLAEITGTTPDLWFDGTPEQKLEAIERAA